MKKLLIFGFIFSVNIYANPIPDACTKMLQHQDAENLKLYSVNSSDQLNIYDVDKRVEFSIKGTGLDVKPSNLIIYSCDSVCLIAPKTDNGTKLSKSSWYIYDPNSYYDGDLKINPEFIKLKNTSWNFLRKPNLVSIAYISSTPGSGWNNRSYRSEFNFNFDINTKAYNLRSLSGNTSAGHCQLIKKNPQAELRSILINELYLGLSSGNYVHSYKASEIIYNNTDNYFFNQDGSMFYISKHLPKSEQVKLINLSTKMEQVLHISKLKDYQSISNYFSFIRNSLSIYDRNNEALKLLKEPNKSKLNCVNLKYRSTVTELNNLEFIKMEYQKNVAEDLLHEFDDYKDGNISYLGVGRLLVSTSNSINSPSRNVYELIEIKDRSYSPEYTSYMVVNRKNGKISFGEVLYLAKLPDNKTSNSYPFKSILIRVDDLLCFR